MFVKHWAGGCTKLCLHSSLWAGNEVIALLLFTAISQISHYSVRFNYFLQAVHCISKIIGQQLPLPLWHWHRYIVEVIGLWDVGKLVWPRVLRPQSGAGGQTLREGDKRQWHLMKMMAEGGVSGWSTTCYVCLLTTKANPITVSVHCGMSFQSRAIMCVPQAQGSVLMPVWFAGRGGLANNLFSSKAWREPQSYFSKWMLTDEQALKAII